MQIRFCQQWLKGAKVELAKSNRPTDVTSEAAIMNKKKITKHSGKPCKLHKQTSKTVPNTTHEPDRDCEKNQLSSGRQLRTSPRRPARYSDFELE